MNQGIYNLIVATAKSGKLVTYSDLATPLGLDLSNESDRNTLTMYLREIAIYEQSCDRPMLTSLVIHKSGDNDPGEGFFSIAKELGLYSGSRRSEDRALFWVGQVSGAHKYWANRI